MFTMQDAQQLVDTAESAPCANLGAAKLTAQLIERFAQFFPDALAAIRYRAESEARIAEQVEAINKKLAAPVDDAPATPPEKVENYA